MICDKFGNVSIDPYHQVEIDRPFVERDSNSGMLNLYICREKEDELIRSFEPESQWSLAQQMLKAKSEKYFMDVDKDRSKYIKQF